MPVKTRSMIKREQEIQRQSEQLQETTLNDNIINLPTSIYYEAKQYYDKCKIKSIVILNNFGKFEQITINLAGAINYNLFEGKSDNFIVNFIKNISIKIKNLIDYNEQLRTCQETNSIYRDLMIDIIILIYNLNLHIFMTSNNIKGEELKTMMNDRNKTLVFLSIQKIKEFKTTIPKYYSIQQQNKLFKALDEYMVNIVNCI